MAFLQSAGTLPVIQTFVNRVWSATLIGSFAHFSSSGEISSRPAARPCRSLPIAVRTSSTLGALSRVSRSGVAADAAESKSLHVVADSCFDSSWQCSRPRSKSFWVEFHTEPSFSATGTESVELPLKFPRISRMTLYTDRRLFCLTPSSACGRSSPQHQATLSP